MKQLRLEYLFPYSINFLKKRFGTASGLSEWFADDVSVNGDTFSFKWGDTEMQAKRVVNTKDTLKFIWLDTGLSTEFKFETNKLSQNTSLIIIETIDDDEDEEETVLYWDNLIKNLKYKLGIN